MLHVLAFITAKPGLRPAVLEAFKANVPNVRAEAGCIAYGATIDATAFEGFKTPFGPDTFVVVEQWEDAAALEAHRTAPHMAAYAAKTRELIAERVIRVLQPVGDA